MMLLVGGDGAGSGFPSCATRFLSVSVDLCVLSLRHLTFSGKSCSLFAAGNRAGCQKPSSFFYVLCICLLCVERARATKKREQGGTGRGYHACAVTEDKKQPDTRRDKKEAADVVPLLSRTGNKAKPV